jgi:dihydropyrimidinase
MTATLIKNGRIVTAVDDYVADILVNTGRVHTIGRDLSVGPDVEVHDNGDPGAPRRR